MEKYPVRNYPRWNTWLLVEVRRRSYLCRNPIGANRCASCRDFTVQFFNIIAIDIWHRPAAKLGKDPLSDYRLVFLNARRADLRRVRGIDIFPPGFDQISNRRGGAPRVPLGMWVSSLVGQAIEAMRLFASERIRPIVVGTDRVAARADMDPALGTGFGDAKVQPARIWIAKQTIAHFAVGRWWRKIAEEKREPVKFLGGHGRDSMSDRC